MCGIAGFAGVGDESDIRAMTDLMRHRGPDDEGIYVDAQANVHLGHRRLTVIDVADGGQPMWSADNTIGVVFNGEIYNHHELREALEARGHKFFSDHSDTEVLIHGYREWGTELPLKLNGMFAFAIYDRARKRLFLARDRMGEKPLFFCHTGVGFVFASELTALCKHGSVSADIDLVAVGKFFAYNFLPAPWTLYRGIHKLPAGHSLIYDVAENSLREQAYWTFHIEPYGGPVSAQQEAAWAEELRELLAQSVARRLESDVPLGFLLSGGIDSSAILALAAETIPADRLKSFTIGFEEASFDESRYADIMARQIGNDHRVEICDLDTAKAMLPDVLSGLDEPVGDSSIIPTRMVCRFARQSVTVALGGDGSDELFAGYDPFKALKMAGWYHRLVPRPVHQAIALLAAKLPRSDANLSFDFKVRRALRGVGETPALWNPVWLGALGPDEVSELISLNPTREQLYAEAIDLWDNCASSDPVDRTMEFYTRLYLADDILVKTDRASMGVSLELRAPFLDNDLVEFSRRLPASVKFRSGEGKYILKRALKDLLPSEILTRPKKGFGIPLGQWLRELSPPEAGDARYLGLDEKSLTSRWHQHAAGKSDQRHALWAWLALHHLPIAQDGPSAAAADPV
jgi:asparagine synthase (glutamine-hydrolysing)